MNRRGFLGALISLPATIPVAGHLCEELAELLLPRKTIILPPVGGWFSFNEDLSYIVRRAFVAKLVNQVYDSSPLIKALMANEPRLILPSAA